MHNIFSFYSERDDIPDNLFTRPVKMNIPVNKQPFILWLTSSVAITASLFHSFNHLLVKVGVGVQKPAEIL